jgi:hypothetical protein
MTDWFQPLFQEQQLNDILKKLNKQESEKNRQILRGSETTFKDRKGGQQTESDTQDDFYKNIIGKPENTQDDFYNYIAGKPEILALLE